MDAKRENCSIYANLFAFRSIVVPIDDLPVLLQPQKTCVVGAARLAAYVGCHKKESRDVDTIVRGLLTVFIRNFCTEVAAEAPPHDVVFWFGSG